MITAACDKTAILRIHRDYGGYPLLRRLRLELEAGRRSCRHEVPSVHPIAVHSQNPFSESVC